MGTNASNDSSSLAHPAPEASRRFQVWGPWLVFAVAVVCYWNTLGNDFTYDDIPFLRGNAYITGQKPWSALWLTDYWTIGHPRQDTQPNSIRDLLYRPVTLQSLRLNYLVHRDAPLGYHLVNLTLHAVISVLVMRLGLQLSLGTTASWVGGLLFAVMPIHVEAVANVMGRAELLAALFTILGMSLSLSPPKNGWRWIVTWALVAALMNAAALLSKEVGLAAFPIGFVCCLVALPTKSRWVKLVIITLVNATLAAGCLALRYVALGGRFTERVVPSEIVNQLADATLWQRFWTVWKLLGMHLAKTINPKTLCMDYSFRAVSLADGPLELHVALGVFFFLAVLAAVYFGARRHGGVLVLAVGWLLTYLPVSNGLFLIKIFYAERLWYSPSIFVALAMGLGVAVLSGWLSKAGWNRVLRHTCLALVGTAAVARCWNRNAEWKDNGTLFASGYRDHPESVQILRCFGDWLMQMGQFEAARDILLRAVTIHPGHTEAQLALGEVYLRLGDARQAVEHLKIAVMQVSGDPKARALLQEAANALSDTEGERIKAAEQTFRADPLDLDNLIAWANVLLETGQIDEALSIMEAERSSFSNSTVFEHQIAVTLTMAGRTKDAVAAYGHCLQLDPNQGVVAAELAMMLLDRREPGDVESAQHWVDHALQVSPNEIPVRVAEAEMFAVVGNLAEAAAAYRRLINSVSADDPRRQAWIIRSQALLGGR